MAKKNSAGNEKKQPERQCMGCNERKLKKELIRIVRTPDGAIELDKTGKKAGRGAYICPKSECLAKLKKSGRLARVLECAIPDTVYTALEEELEKDD